MLYTLEGLYKILENSFWLNNVYKIRNAENKIYQLLLAKEIGFSIPDSLITNIPDKASYFFKEKNSSCILKPIKSGLVEGEIEEGVIFTNEIILNHDNAQRIASCPTYFQNLVNKKGDVRITAVGDSLYPAFIHSQDENDSKTDWRKSVKLLKHSTFKLPDDISNKCIKLLKRLELNFGAIDFILDEDDNLIFLEINPNGQWAWIEKRLNYPISKEITKILIEKTIN
jgi:glutathione synthase/RimK-type ligase-like ATP-grasp enzyme